MAKGRGLRQEMCRQVISIDPNGFGALNERSERGPPCWRAFEAKQPSCSVSGATTVHAKLPVWIDRPGPDESRSDVDIAARGCPPEPFYRLAAGLERALGLPPDLVELD
jgi:hypothetical protein